MTILGPLAALTTSALTDTLVWLHEQTNGLPLMVTENGSAWYDPPQAIDGRIHDPMRVDYLKNHLKALHDAIGKGVDVRGYMAWSLLDNLEWSLGYAKRFGHGSPCCCGAALSCRSALG